MTSRHLAITMGDPAGIGPEIIVKACIGLKERIAKADLRLLIIGSGAALDGAKAALGAVVAIPEVTADARDWPNLCYLQADAEGDPIKPGVLSADGGRFAYKAIEQGVRLTQAGRTAAIAILGLAIPSRRSASLVRSITRRSRSGVRRFGTSSSATWVETWLTRMLP